MAGPKGLKESPAATAAEVPGAGKTTTVGMLSTRVITETGSVRVGGVDVVAHPAPCGRSSPGSAAAAFGGACSADERPGAGRREGE